MAEGKTAKLDVILIVVLLAVMVGGFWMTGSAMHERTEVINQKVEVVQSQTKETLDVILDVQRALREVKGGQAAAAAAAPAAAVAAPAPAPKK
jgi:hypothetical protein